MKAPTRFYVLVKDWGTAVRIAAGYLGRGRNGAYQETPEGFLVSWDSKPL